MQGRRRVSKTWSVQVRSWKWRFTTRRVSRIDQAELKGPKVRTPGPRGSRARRTSIRGAGWRPSIASTMKSLSSRSTTLKRGRWRLMSSFSRSTASFSVRVTITSIPPSRSSRSATKARSSVRAAPK